MARFRQVAVSLANSTSWTGQVGSVKLNCLAIHAILRHVADEETAAGITRFIINPSMDTIKTNLKNRLADILHPHLSGHPITYNHYLTENFQNKQDERRRFDMEHWLSQSFGWEFPYVAETHTFTLKSLIDSLMSSSELDMDVYSCSAAIYMTEAYYLWGGLTFREPCVVYSTRIGSFQSDPDPLQGKIVMEVDYTSTKVAANYIPPSFFGSVAEDALMSCYVVMGHPILAAQ